MLPYGTQEVDNKDPEHEDYWEALLEVVEAELVVALRQEEIDRARLRGDSVPEAEEEDEGGLHTALDADIHASMAGEGALLLDMWTSTKRFHGSSIVFDTLLH